MPTRRIFFTQLALDARIGILEHELRATQPLHVDAEFDVDVQQEVQDQDIRTVLDYRLLREFPAVLRLKIRISKPLAFSDCAAVGLEIERGRVV